MVVDDGTVMVSDVTVTQADVLASNGIIHVIDKVLLPPDSDLGGSDGATTGATAAPGTTAATDAATTGATTVPEEGGRGGVHGD